MANPFDISAFNLLQFAEMINNLYDDTPMNLQVPVKQPDGSITYKNIQNLGQFKQRIWDTINANMQFNTARFYVDPVNGADTNDGLSADTAFRTIKKAVDSVNIGGVGEIYIIGKYNVEPFEFVTFTNKYISLRLKNNSQINFKIGDYDNEYAQMGHIQIRYSGGLFIYIDNLETDIVDSKIKISENNTGKPLRPSLDSAFQWDGVYSGNVFLGISGRLRSGKWFNIQTGSLFGRSQWSADRTAGQSIFFNTIHMSSTSIIGDNAYLISDIGNALITFNGLNLKDNAGNSVDPITKIKGLQTDANGNYTNAQIAIYN